MIELARTVRFCVNPADRADLGIPDRRPDPAAIPNAFAGWPSMIGLGAFYELQVICRGEPNPVTGYLMNISTIDKAVRECSIPLIQRAASENPHEDPAALLPQILAALQPSLHHAVASVRWRLTPYYALTMTATATDRILMSQQFEFSASHRLHVPDLGEERNREIFGKCNNPNSHGHNYRLEVTVAANLNDSTWFTLAELERVVDEIILQRFDHKHLNLDTAEFAALNPSVENMAKVCHDLLREPIRRAGAELNTIKVWETEKTSCTYPAA